MKDVTRSIKLLPVLLMATMISCNSVEKKSEVVTDSTTVSVSPPPELKKEMFIKHKVANYAKWKPLYDADSTNRLANGLHDHIVARGNDDPNMVMVIFYMDDVAKAQTMAADPKLKEVMKKAGVMGAPEIDYVDRVMNDTSKTEQTARVMIKHKVKDFGAWKKIFDSDKQARMDAGLSDRMVGYSVGDNHMVTLILVVNDEAKAKAFMNDKRLADKMKEGGVEGPPSVFFYHVVEKHS
ncbi:MAG: hypothetical protein V4539_00850 [Bacteroidota bacterium]